MKYLSIALFLFFFQVSLAGINAVGLTEYQKAPAQEWFDVASIDDLETQEYAQQVVDSNAFFDIVGTVTSVFIFLGKFAFGVVVFPYVLVQFGMSWGLATIFSLPVGLIYSLALFQYFGNRQTKGMR